MKAERLLSILLLLQNHGRLSSRQLAERLEVSERTVHRDMEALSAAGIPVYAERGSAGGWCLAEGFRTNLTGMTGEEIRALHLAAPLAQLGDLGMRGAFDAAFQKLVAASPTAVRRDAEQVRERLHIDGAGWHQSDEEVPLLATVQDAVWAGRKLAMTYRREDALVERVVEPLGLVAKRSVWYLVAQVEGDIRTYRISRLIRAQLLDETFTRPADFDLASFWDTSTAQFKANLPVYPASVRFHEKLLPRLQQERYVKLIHTAPAKNGWILAQVQFHTLESACELALGYGAQLEIIEPLELRQRMIAEIASLHALYASDLPS
ncbi:helix-turn-helix transcriptional regulator [Brevibacillus fluminis]|uniref:helix-turn-helix transcriptional regulator n=1 Tax=Brevibacillus fluminis TaxID=511487 RepID=UPI003F89D48B